MYSFDPVKLASVEKAISKPRLNRYVAMAGGDLEQAVKLHNWNTKLGSSLHLPLQLFELVFRNTLDATLAAKYASNWYDAKYHHFDPKSQKQIDAAKDQLVNQGRPLSVPCVIAQFSFGFWLNMLTRKHETRFWVAALHASFPNAPRPPVRQNVHNSVDKIRVLRNRIAHHEPIYQRSLEQDLSHVVVVTRWMCPDTADWIESFRGELLEAIARRPV